MKKHPEIPVQYLKVNDREPYYSFLVKDWRTNTRISLTGATIVCTMVDVSDNTVKINRQSAGILIAPDQDANKGEAQYQWQAGDTDTEGTYKIEFEITPAVGQKFTLPPNDIEMPAIVVISSSLDSV